MVSVKIQRVRCHRDKKATDAVRQGSPTVLVSPIPAATAVGVATTTAGADPTGCSRICHL